MQDSPDARRDSLLDWLSRGPGLSVRHMEPASKDASFRRYFRVFAGDAQYIAMDAPPDKENSEPFVRVAGWLANMELNSPRVLAENLDQGFLLLTDLGERQYLDELRQHPERADELYGDAVNALVRMQQHGGEYQSKLPPYDRDLLRTELGLFRDWLCGTHLALDFSEREEAAWQQCCEFLTGAALQQPRVFVHRDYHSRNLMVCDGDNPGILDFQDAVEGALTYDLVSLLRDCYVSWPQSYVESLALDFYSQRRDQLEKNYDEERFLRDFDLSGVQRQLKAAGIFARLEIRDGKTGYLKDAPRTLNYILERAPHYPELAFLETFIVERCLPALEASL